MKYILAVVALLFLSSSSLFGQQQQQVSAFSSLSITTSGRNYQQTTASSSTSTSTTTTSTQLYYNIIAPPDDDNCEVDSSNCEESVFDRKKREKLEKDQGRRELYAKKGLNIDEIDKVNTSLSANAIDQMHTPDQFDNAAGGGIIPGMQMSALMEDD